MKPDRQSGPSNFQSLSAITERMLKSYKVTAPASTENETCNPEDERLADEAWLDFLASHLPNAGDVRHDLSSST
jgi:hypothetical protein